VASFSRQPLRLTHKYETLFQTLARRNNYNLYSRRHDAQQNDTLESNILHKGIKHNTKNETLGITAFKPECYCAFIVNLSFLVVNVIMLIVKALLPTSVNFTNIKFYRIEPSSKVFSIVLDSMIH
jgi:hypothetical protein